MSHNLSSLKGLSRESYTGCITVVLNEDTRSLDFPRNSYFFQGSP